MQDIAKSKGGPRTSQGKSISSRNALKIGLYSNSLLQDEDGAEIEAMLQALVTQWGVRGVQAQLLARDYAYCEIKLGRIHKARIALLQSRMYRHDARFEFAKQVNISPLLVGSLPDWYFLDDEKRQQVALQRASLLTPAQFASANKGSGVVAGGHGFGGQQSSANAE
jgi:hypothetical protein